MTDEQARKVGRPTLKTPELLAEILRRAADGESLRSICRDDAMPERRSIHRWLAEDPEFSRQYAWTNEVRADAIFDELMEIADNEAGDAIRDRLRVDARKWALARMNARKYSDKVTVGGTGEDGKIVIEIVRHADQDSE